VGVFTETRCIYYVECVVKLYCPVVVGPSSLCLFCSLHCFSHFMYTTAALLSIILADCFVKAVLHMKFTAMASMQYRLLSM